MASRFTTALKALQQLGPSQVGNYALYQLGVRTGHYQRILNHSLSRLKVLNQPAALRLHPCLPGLPQQAELQSLLGDRINSLYNQADEILAGKVRLFGSKPVPLVLEASEQLGNWTLYERGNAQADGQDIKIIWEPGRFGWAITLAMAFHLSGNQRYATCYWEYFERFTAANPPYYGPHWSSAQEAAIRLIAQAFCLQAFIPQATPRQLEMAARSITEHAARIPPTMVYALSQNNNHLISEASGLYTASALLPEHPWAARWHRLGWDQFLHALSTQIDPDGTYIQHSTNYHRLMLQAAIWAQAVHDHAFKDEPIPDEIRDRLAAATTWLGNLLDPYTGQVPNLGHNDGSYILPLSACPYNDYRPIINAAARSFNKIRLLPPGVWDDMSYWLGTLPEAAQSLSTSKTQRTGSTSLAISAPHVILNHVNGTWATLRIGNFHSRPAHADQLHLDLWWHGLNIAQDPGTYSYNLPPPWDNGLCRASVHNTITIDSLEYMLRAGRFLYLDWAQAKLIHPQPEATRDIVCLSAQHDGYHKMGITHTRQVIAHPDGRWEILDQLEGPLKQAHRARIHWLLPDWPYKHEPTGVQNRWAGSEIRVQSPFGWVSLQVITPIPDLESNSNQEPKIQIARAGTLLHGSGDVSPLSGWASPTYGEKIPALAFSLEVTRSLPIFIKTEWRLPDESQSSSNSDRG